MGAPVGFRISDFDYVSDYERDYEILGVPFGIGFRVSFGFRISDFEFYSSLLDPPRPFC